MEVKPIGDQQQVHQSFVTNLASLGSHHDLKYKRCLHNRTCHMHLQLWDQWKLHLKKTSERNFKSLTYTYYIIQIVSTTWMWSFLLGNYNGTQISRTILIHWRWKPRKAPPIPEKNSDKRRPGTTRSWCFEWESSAFHMDFTVRFRLGSPKAFMRIRSCFLLRSKWRLAIVQKSFVQYTATTMLVSPSNHKP